MGYKKLYKKLPDCHVLESLFKKVTKLKNVDFDYFGILNNIRERISLESSQINILFPEFTPHDEENHLKHLFILADKIINIKIINSMNAAELFLLSMSIYCHDWGMSISENEKEFILTGKIKTHNDIDYLIENEDKLFINYAIEQGLKKNKYGKLDEVPIEILRNYIRDTHALRSAERIKKVLKNVNINILETIADICLGHASDFEYLENNSIYPTDKSLLSEIVNVRAITIYLRIIDMFDLSEDRTPYILWKFISPKNDYSKMEWEKHKSLQPITVNKISNGRFIQVDGTTNDSEVYASLMDLKSWVEEQFNNCRGILYRMQDKKYQIDIYYIDWRIRPIGFEPTLIKFSFDREKIFEIISCEIFNRDKKIFLRELIQNSIDAIRFRREFTKQKGLARNIKEFIEINVEKNNDYIVLTCSDNGIGMDEYIIRNYLSTIGRSYYRSFEFEKINIEVDPISQFGIGILSCFMVADKIEIETQIDPYFKPKSNGLSIVIPNEKIYFRIKKKPTNLEEIGTKIKVYISEKKLGREEFSNFNVANYLLKTASYAEFPIIVSENNKNFLIVKPKTNIAKVEKILPNKLKESLNIYTLDLDNYYLKYLPKTLADRYSYFKENQFDISKDLKLKKYEGVINVLIPSNENIDFSNAPAEGRVLLIRDKQKRKIKEIELDYVWSDYDYNNKPFAIYRDGFLLKDVSPPAWYTREFHSPNIFPRILPKPQIIVNIPKSKSRSIDIARTKILNKQERWDIPIYIKYLKYLSKNIFKDILKIEPKERLYQLGRFCLFYHIHTRDLIEYFPIENLPIIFLNSYGVLEIIEYKILNDRKVFTAPENLTEEYRKLVKCQWLTGLDYNGILNQWDNGKCIITKANYVSIAINNALEISFNCFKEKYYCRGIQFIDNIRNPEVLSFNYIWNKKDKKIKEHDLKEVLMKTIENPCELNPYEIDFLNQNQYYGIPEAFYFPTPYKNKFSYAWRLLNINNSKSRLLLKTLAKIKLLEIDKSMDSKQIKYLRSAIDGLPSFNSLYYDSFYYKLSSFYNVLKEFNIISDKDEIKNFLPDRDELISKTIDIEYHKP